MVYNTLLILFKSLITLNQLEIQELRKKLPELKKLYKDEKTPIKVVGKVLKNKEIDEIQTLIKNKIDVEIEFDMPKSLGLHTITKTFEKEIAIWVCGGCTVNNPPKLIMEDIR